MSKPETGGSAFPIVPPIDSDGRAPTGYPFPDSGMTLRQYYAGQALLGILSGPASREGVPRKEWFDIPKEAFALADAMIAEGSK